MGHGTGFVFVPSVVGFRSGGGGGVGLAVGSIGEAEDEEL